MAKSRITGRVKPENRVPATTFNQISEALCFCTVLRDVQFAALWEKMLFTFSSCFGDYLQPKPRICGFFECSSKACKFLKK